MNENIGILDRVLRVIIGLGTYVLFFTDIISGGLGLTFVAIATVFLLTSFVSICPLYKLISFKTN